MKENTLLLKNVPQPKVSSIINDFLNKGEGNCKDLRNNLSRYKNIFHYSIQMFFLKFTVQPKGEASISRAVSTLFLKPTKIIKKIEASLGKNPHNHEEIRDETCVYEQKPIKIDDFNEDEEKEVKDRVEKRKEKIRQVAENNKLLKIKKKKKKIEDNKKKRKKK